MTALLFRDDPYQAEAEAVVVGHSAEGAIILDRTVFYPTGGGQPGDSGHLLWEDKKLPIATAVKIGSDQIGLVAAEPLLMPAVGTMVRQVLDWKRRHRHMRVHTALHLLSVVIPLPVTGGQIGADKGRLDFLMPEVPSDMQAIEDALNRLIDRDLAVTESWITDEELLANPGLVKTMSVMPPTGQGRVRLVRIGTGSGQIDLQPCGGTHVSRTAEIGRIALGKVENKGRQNRRVSLSLVD
ncbi:alanyl-tRNA editing protein [Pseudorhodobacter ferrugineus]|uniref:alanyl-tRNA editing protein n=1 Tax=Pseudorhodobacter ferrugineus TaxID=77008 RepID=UPI0003B39E10|nr:alanyl-tRNA editing protein [Pseudorhodobacter ferrugineus]